MVTSDTNFSHDLDVLHYVIFVGKYIVDFFLSLMVLTSPCPFLVCFLFKQGVDDFQVVSQRNLLGLLLISCFMCKLS